MRQIKFRAWIRNGIDQPFMADVADLSEKHVGVWIHGAGPFPFLRNHCTLMQFTGLHDQNGREIYEGDILWWTGLTLPVTVDEFHGYRFMFGKDTLCRSYAVGGKVVGNIYENPEHLTETP